MKKEVHRVISSPLEMNSSYVFCYSPRSVSSTWRKQTRGITQLHTKMPLLRNRVLDQDRMVATDCLFWYYSLLIHSTLYEEDVFIGKLPTAEGQIISKCLFRVFHFFQKLNENTLHTSKNKFICSFYRRTHGLTICFRN